MKKTQLVFQLFGPCSQ